jgi:hypothetical protein
MNPVPVQDRLSPVAVFEHAAAMPKLIMLSLLVAMLAALIVCAMKLASGPRLSGGSAFLSGLRLGGPVMGGLGAAWAGLGMAIGLANMAGAVPPTVLARGYAEVLLLLVLGFLAGVVAVIANWAVDSRIDRSVLKA